MRKLMRKVKKNWVVVGVAAASVIAAGAGATAEADTIDTVTPATGATSETTTAITDSALDVATPSVADATDETDTTTELDTQPVVTEPVEDVATPLATNEEVMAVTEESVATVETPETLVAEEIPVPVAADFGLTEEAFAIATEAGIDVTSLTDVQKTALNRVQRDVTAETGSQMTYKQFEDIANTLVAQDERYAIPYFNATAIKNMDAATARNAQTGEVAEMDVWDSWPVQDIKTGEVVNWNGYQLVVAMMGVPNTNDNHLYLLYNKYADNNFDNWKNAGAIFGYDSTPVIQQWSGSAVVNSDDTIQLYYTHVDTSDRHSNNQQLATATLRLGFDENDVQLLSVENDTVLTPAGGDGYYYQSYKQWRETFTGADNIAMRDPHIIEGEDGSRYLIFEASTGTQNYQGEDQIYNWSNYGGDAAYNVKSLFSILENADMYERAKFANAAIGILKLTGSEKNPEIQEYYTPLVSSPMVSDEIERPNVVKLGDKYYLFAASRLNHGSNNHAWNLANSVVGDNVVMLGYVSNELTKGYEPLNQSGIVLTASVPADWRTATYSYYTVPVEGSSDTLLVTAYMTNRNEVAGKGNNSTWAPSFLIQILPDNTTRVLAKMTEQGDWIWDESSDVKHTVGTLATAHLPGEDDGYIEWSGIGGYGLKDHNGYNPKENNDPHNPTNPTNPHPTSPNGETPNTPTENHDVPKVNVETPKGGRDIPSTTPVQAAGALPQTGQDSSYSVLLGMAGLATLAVAAYVRRKEY